MAMNVNHVCGEKHKDERLPNQLMHPYIRRRKCVKKQQWCNPI